MGPDGWDEVSFDNIRSVVYEITAIGTGDERLAEMIATEVETTLDVKPSTLLLTTAPEVYDYGWTTSLGQTHGLYPSDLRLVRIENERLTYQVERYLSGSYLATEVR